MTTERTALDAAYRELERVRKQLADAQAERDAARDGCQKLNWQVVELIDQRDALAESIDQRAQHDRYDALGAREADAHEDAAGEHAW